MRDAGATVSTFVLVLFGAFVFVCVLTFWLLWYGYAWCCVRCVTRGPRTRPRGTGRGPPNLRRETRRPPDRLRVSPSAVAVSAVAAGAVRVGDERETGTSYR